jgi:hypothetical protein
MQVAVRHPSVPGVLFRLLAVFLAAALAPLVGAAAASAHGVSVPIGYEFAQTIAGVELTVVIRPSTAVPGPLRVDLVAHQTVPDLVVDLAARSTTCAGTASGSLRLRVGQPGSYPAQLWASCTGSYELEVRAGGEASTLPFRVLLPGTAGWQVVAYAGMGVAGLLLVSALLAAALPRPALAAVLGVATLAALLVAGTVMVLSADLPSPPPAGAAPVPAPLGGSGRPYAQAFIGTDPAHPAPGADATLRVDLIDGATGEPVDDLVPHHAALAHLVVTSLDGGFFQHTHPRRTGPGRLAVRLRALPSGEYLVAVEFTRTDSGSQLVTARFAVGSGAPVPPVEPGRPAGLSMTPLVAGRPTTLEFATGPGNLQRWLGMTGHLFLRDRDGGFFGHVHETGPLAPGGVDETVAVPVAALRFTVSFPRPGRYFGWLQYARDFRIMTVPFAVDVAAPR